MSHFAGGSVFELVRQQERDLGDAVREMGDETLLRSADDVTGDLVDGFTLHVPTLHSDRVERVDGGEVPGSPGTVRVVFAVPFDGQEELFSITPSTHQLTRFTGVVRNRDVLFTITQRGATKESIERELQVQLDVYATELDRLRADVRYFNAGLPAKAAGLVKSRRDQLLRTRDVLASLEFPVRKRADAVIPVPVARRVHVTRPASVQGESFAPEPEMSSHDYEDVLASTRSMGLVMERAPGTFSGLAEEGIRDFFLALLNFGFRGEAMAEVFNGEGKSDILIRSGERNVFIAECKVWNGEAKFEADAVDQLLRYLGWRDTKCTILLFVHARSVSDVLDKADAVIGRHACFKREAPGAVGELERRYVLHWPGDGRRELVLTLQVFAVPATQPRRSRRH